MLCGLGGRFGRARGSCAMRNRPGSLFSLTRVTASKAHARIYLMNVRGLGDKQLLERIRRFAEPKREDTEIHCRPSTR